jgi:hypothetical protein
MKYYKLTNTKGQTYRGTQWGEGVTHKATGKGNSLCSKDVIHVYDSPLKAVIFNPIHADFRKYQLWECSVKRVVNKDFGKVGVKKCTTIRVIPAPEITTNTKIRFAILCALKVYKEAGFVTWAKNWLSGKNAAAYAANAAASATSAAAYAANAANATDKPLNFHSLIKKAIQDEHRYEASLTTSKKVK